MVEVLGSTDVVIRGNLGPLEADLQRAHALVTQFNNAVAGAGGQGAKAANDFKKASAEADGFGKVLGFVRSQLIGIGLVLGIAQLQELAGTWSDLRFRLKATLGSLEAADEVMSRLEISARRTYTSFQTTTESFDYSSRALRELGYSTKTQLDYFEALNNALVVSGAKGQRAASVQHALGKAIAIGALRGQELNTVLSSGGRIAEVIAKSLGVTTNKLRVMGQEGKLTSAVIVKALLGARAELQRLADDMPATIQDAMIIMGNSVLSFVGRLDQAFDVTGKQARSLVALADAIRNAAVPAIALIKTGLVLFDQALRTVGFSLEGFQKAMDITFLVTIGTLAVVAVIALGKVLSGYLVSAIMAVVGALRVLAVAVLTNPLILLGTLLVGAAAAAYIFRDNIKQAIGVDVVGVFKNTSNLIISSMRVAFLVVQNTWQNFPDVMESFATDVLNFFIRMSNGITTAVAGAINAVIDQINSVQSYLNLLGIPVGQIGKVGAHTDAEIPNFAKARLQIRAQLGGLAAEIEKAWSTDWLGNLGAAAETAFTSVSVAAQKMVDDLDKVIDDMDPKAAAAFAQMIVQVERFITAQNLEAKALGLTSEQAQTLRFEQDLLNQAEDANIPITAALREQIKGWAADMAHAESRTAKMAEAFNFAKESVKGFVSDLSQGLRQGKGFFEAFTDAVLNLLNKVLDKLADVAIEAAFANLGGGGGGGGWVTQLASLVTGLFHQGGVVGQSVVPTRRVPAMAFANAQRLHSGTGSVAGLGSGEVPAILQEGETVIPRGGNGQQGIVRIIVQTVESPYFDSRVDARAAGAAVQVVRETDRQKSRVQARTR